MVHFLLPIIQKCELGYSLYESELLPVSMNFITYQELRSSTNRSNSITKDNGTIID